MKEYDAYLFDADGTLMDTREAIERSFVHMAGEMGMEPPDSAMIQGTIGLALRDQLRLILGEGHPDEYYQTARGAYHDCLMTNYKAWLKAFPGVGEGIRELKRRGKKLALVTSRSMDGLEAFMRALDLHGLFDVLIAMESTTKNKPEPDPALEAARQLGVPPSACVFIGDATFDIECGHAAGMDTVLVSWGGMDPTGWKVRPDLIVDGFAQLLPEG